ncbi:ribosomal-processing cysteine protease Prp [[Ruminococcus] lactaris]|uniref:ribosomal-processing cysteine protease Prp n=1 Tax=[Ruminococcus] lactaris TaxID=46228 RepID=UPI003AB2F098
MIQITITPNNIHMTGHACRKGSDGIDRACAAVSALTCNLINSLRDLASDRICAETVSGMEVIEWSDLSDAGRLLVDSWFLGMADIADEYNCITFT